MLLLFFILLFSLILNPDISSQSVIEATNLFINRLVPILYPNFIIIDFIANDSKIDIIASYLFPIFKKIFKINYISSVSIIILSFICGMPSTAKMIRNSIDNNQLDENEGFSLLLGFSFMSISYEIILFNKFNILYIPFLILKILFSIIIMNITNKSINNKDINIDNSNKKGLLECLFISIKRNLDILLSILGIIILFNILLRLLNINDIIYPFIEPLTGHTLLLKLEINKKLKDAIFIASMGFLGISIHLQILYIYPNIKYIKYFFIMLLKALLTSFIFFFFIS